MQWVNNPLLSLCTNVAKTETKMCLTLQSAFVCWSMLHNPEHVSSFYFTHTPATSVCFSVCGKVPVSRGQSVCGLLQGVRPTPRLPRSLGWDELHWWYTHVHTRTHTHTYTTRQHTFYTYFCKLWQINVKHSKAFKCAEFRVVTTWNTSVIMCWSLEIQNWNIYRGDGSSSNTLFERPSLSQSAILHHHVETRSVQRVQLPLNLIYTNICV